MAATPVRLHTREAVLDLSPLQPKRPLPPLLLKAPRRAAPRPAALATASVALARRVASPEQALIGSNLRRGERAAKRNPEHFQTRRQSEDRFGSRPDAVHAPWSPQLKLPPPHASSTDPSLSLNSQAAERAAAKAKPSSVADAVPIKRRIHSYKERRRHHQLTMRSSFGGKARGAAAPAPATHPRYVPQRGVVLKGVLGWFFGCFRPAKTRPLPAGR
ncbi:hypothetical protein OsI_08855 [Oryza sativa Indica Group]|uniref:Uncharacterized protein n=1 Tax=Oryza sativa subsp. indica TaxID=39946 RepID=B8AI35_ORYSI|nr:hypothetical protein OsI_08855 [Oryza sativa Indica Group]